MERLTEPMVANDLLDDAAALKEQMDREGYLFLRGLFDREVIHQIRLQALEICREAGLLREGTPLEDAIPAKARDEVPDSVLAPVRRKLFGLEAVHVFFHSPPITDVMQKLIGEPIVPHVHKQVRLQFPVTPGTPAQTTAPHQDFVYNQGTLDVYTCWVPLGDVPRAFGGLQVLPGSHKHGILDVQRPPDGSITLTVDETALAGEWVSPDYHMGDAILFHSLTLHGAPENRSNALRLSMDCRYQAIAQPFSEKLLEPLPGVIDAYPNWKSQDLQYYWKRLDLKVVEHDMSYLEKTGIAPRS
jgi:ectoine hydroxylase-related dioxygenase (phytanoyl-CoA dioxygenase family)